MSILFFDVETTGFYRKQLAYDDDLQPHIVQFAAILSDENGNSIAEVSAIVKPIGYEIPQQSVEIHGIDTEYALKHGIRIETAMSILDQLLENSSILVCHNEEFDSNVAACECHRLKNSDHWSGQDRQHFCTMKSSTNLCKLPGNYGYKWPKLEEAYEFFFKEKLLDAHDALADVRACMRIYFELKRLENLTGETDVTGHTTGH